MVADVAELWGGIGSCGVVICGGHGLLWGRASVGGGMVCYRRLASMHEPLFLLRPTNVTPLQLCSAVIKYYAGGRISPSLALF
jgi:hypothetical protein